MTTPLALLYHEGHTREHEPLLYTSVGGGRADRRARRLGLAMVLC